MKYWLPNLDTGEMEERETPHQENCVIIIGANGSGKSHLVTAMEKYDFDLHKEKTTYLRISAQRDLTFERHIKLKGFEVAENYILAGDEKTLDYKFINKWHTNYSDSDESGTTYPTDDFDYVLAALIAKVNLEYKTISDKVALADDTENIKSFKDEAINNTLERLKRIWRNILPEREIDIEDDEVLAWKPTDTTDEKDAEETKKYPGKFMSDGERTCLYLIAQCLCAPEGETIIVDEPELHLHPSIMHPLWLSVEKERSDCHFIYVTHDTDFAAQHTNAEIIWVKSYDGTKWDYKILTDGNKLPGPLILSILGSRRKILFIEGNNDSSYDLKLYNQLFNNMKVTPCESCKTVIERTKTYFRSKDLHHIAVYGLIDRDYRTTEQIKKYQENDIFTLKVAEVENLFLTEKFLKLFCDWQGVPEKTTEKLIQLIKEKVTEKFQNSINEQIKDAVVRNVKDELSSMDIKPRKIEANLDAMIGAFNGKIAEIVKRNWERIEGVFKEAAEKKDYNQVLQLFNNKRLVYDIPKQCLSELKLGDAYKGVFSNYPESVILMFNKEDGRKKIQDALKEYFPDELWNLNSQDKTIGYDN